MHFLSKLVILFLDQFFLFLVSWILLQNFSSHIMNFLFKYYLSRLVSYLMKIKIAVLYNGIIKKYFTNNIDFGMSIFCE